MLQYTIKRILLMIPTVLIISVIAFWIIQLPPGDYLTSYIAELEEMGEEADPEIVENLRIRYGLDRPFYVQYGKWIGGILLRGDFGYSFENNMRVSVLIEERLLTTVLVSLFSILFTYVAAIPIGIYSATHQYSPGDYAATFIGFIGMATPNFLLALVLMYLSFILTGQSPVGLFSPEYIDAAWSFGKLADMMKHMLIPIIVIGTSGTCALIRVMRSQLLDELRRQYVITARAKGMGEVKLLWKYPVRASLNPIVSTIGWSLTSIFSGSTITAIVLNLPTQGPVLYRALKSQDMYLAGGFLFILSILTVFGTLISDILLAWLDPRIKIGKEV